jgi:phage tail P2-like protein
MADKRLIPEGIRDTSTEAFNELIDRLGSLDLTPLLIYIIDNVHASALPHLAEQFHIAGLEGWSFAQTNKEKRALIKRAIELHRYKGTPWAVENALNSISIDGSVTEWFQYGGNPYRFRVSIDVKDIGINLDTITLIEKLINQYKNVRSWLDLLILYIKSHGITPKFGCATLMGEDMLIYPYQQGLIEATGTVPRFIGGHAIDVEETTIYPQ